MGLFHWLGREPFFTFYFRQYTYAYNFINIHSPHDTFKERATLWMLEDDETNDKKQPVIWSRVASGVDGIIQAPIKGSIVGECISSGKTINIQDAYQDKRFNPEVDIKTGFHTTSVLAVPVKNKEGKVIGAIQMINKQKEMEAEGGEKAVFSEGDIKCVQMLCSHVANFIRVVYA